METKGILRVVLVIVSSLMMLGSICDNGNKGGGNPLEPDPEVVIEVFTNYYGAGGICVNAFIKPSTSNCTIDFGDVEVGATAKDPYIAIANNTTNFWPGQTPPLKYILWLDATSTYAAAFSLSPHYSKPCAFTNIVSATLSPSTLEIGDNCNAEVVFKPDYEGNHMAKVTIQSNDADDPEVWIWLKGYGVCSPNNFSSGCESEWPKYEEPPSDGGKKTRSEKMR